MNAAYYGQKIDNRLLTGNSFNNIGYIYFEKDLYDSAIVNYQKALPYYDKVGNATREKLTTFTYLGSTYEAFNQLDSASIYFDMCLSLSKKTKNEEYQFSSLKNLGVVSYGMEKNDKAIDYFQSALAMATTNIPETRQINLYLLRIYNKQHNLKSGKQYADLLIASLPEVTNKYTVKEIYAALADYSQQLGDYKQAFEYGDLEKATQNQIENEINAASLLAADKRFHMSQQARENRKNEVKLFFLIIILVVAFLTTLFFVIISRRDSKKHKAMLKLHTDKFNEFRKILATMRDETSKHEEEIKNMMNDN